MKRKNEQENKTQQEDISSEQYWIHIPNFMPHFIHRFVITLFDYVQYNFFSNTRTPLWHAQGK